MMFDGFERSQVETTGATINFVVGGGGPPLLLLHGYPETHVMWHLIAPELARDFTVVAVDLRGYGDSSKPAGDADHANYSKRVMAQDQIEVMATLGFDRFGVAGHDRGQPAGEVETGEGADERRPPHVADHADARCDHHVERFGREPSDDVPAAAERTEL